MNRIAPDGGYVGGRKNHYRRNIWASFRSFAGCERAHARALLMPSIEGKEVEAAIAAGFRQENLFLVDRNGAIAAHLKRRYPRATCFGIDVAEAARRIAAAGVQLAVANLDLCSEVTTGGRRVFHEFLRTDVMAPLSAVAVTVVRGREQRFDLLRTIAGGYPRPDGPRAMDGARVDVLYLATHGLGYRRDLWRAGVYKSTAGHQTMLWTIWLLQWTGELDDRERKQRAREKIRRRASLVWRRIQRLNRKGGAPIALYQQHLDLVRTATELL